ncbi:T6SS effector amidase Tae4 family protein [Chryseobacterium sp. JK1]|uniref:T6SS effector amidase Tae4 family protein n=1 Tax=Chryseobacterium sp. JK1 TaxID=874294 RepID=UPI003D69DC7C
MANSCAIRMSRGLNLSGFKLPKSNSGYGTKGGVMSGDKNQSYWLRVRELSPYLAEHLGKPEIDIKLDEIKMPDTYKKRKSVNPTEWQQLKAMKKAISPAEWTTIRKTKGVIVFDVSGWDDATGHFTLWDTQHLIYPGNPQHDDPTNTKYYFSMLYLKINKKNELDFVQTNRIRVWELK